MMNASPRLPFSPPGPCDVCIIGAGAAGGVLAQRLAEAGWEVVVLDAGPLWDPQNDWSSDELATENQAWRDLRFVDGANPLKLAKNNCGKGVGGGTVHFNGVALRFAEDDFRIRSTDGVGADWPLGYDDLAPYYDTIEDEVKVSGPRDWPWRPKRPPYPYPARDPLSAPAMLFRQGCEQLGVASVPAPLFILSAPHGDRPPCNNRGFCNQGCMTNAKFSTLITHIPRAMAHGARVLDRCMATAIRLDVWGLAKGVTYLRDGVEYEQKARLVIVSAFCIETPRLLLLSACAGHPDGLANSSGMVGRGLMVHASDDVWAVFPEETRPYKGTPVLALTQAFYASDPSRGFARGYTIVAHGFRPVAFARTIAEQHQLWGAALQELLRGYNHYAKFTLVGEVLPNPDNRVTLSDGKDQHGLPAPRVTFGYGDNDRALIAHGVQRMREIAEAAGGTVRFVTQDTAHMMGACPMGSDAKTSVVDPFGRSWDVPNLFVCDASVFVSGSGCNPTLTVMALAARTADYIIGQSQTGLLRRRGAGAGSCS